MIDPLSAYKVFWSNVIALSIFVFEFCYFYFYTHLLYKFTTFEATKWLLWQYGVILNLPVCFRYKDIKSHKKSAFYTGWRKSYGRLNKKND